MNQIFRHWSKVAIETIQFVPVTHYDVSITPRLAKNI